MGWSPKDGDPIKLYGAFFTLCTILRFVVALAAEVKLGALFLNCKEGIIFRLTLEELGHPQPRTGALRRFHNRRHCKQHRKTATIAIDGNAIFLGW